ncbi:MAG: D-aminoacyl-tRNA deacylase [Desulfurococcales archaeon]|nr:D-aminoacyl-tRNA deacylase [Desulfurococcales archaeon]
MKPRLAIAYSVNDPAGKGAAEKLLQLYEWSPYECNHAVECFKLSNGVVMGGYREETIHFDFIDETPDPSADAVIILSRHSAVSGRPSLTTHHTGNPTGRAEYGGEPYKLSIAAPPLSRALLRAYRSEAEKLGLLNEYEVTLEATHHGPTKPSKPLVFIEIGSTPDRWRDERARLAMARAVARVIDGEIEDCEPAAGFGEPHYPVKFTRIHLDGDYCMGHIIAKYAIPDANEDVIAQAVKNNWPRPHATALVQKKAARSEVRRRLVKVLEGLGVDVVII